MSRILIAALITIIPLALSAQQVEVTRYDVDQGLPQSMVNHVVQDSLGFIWLGTGDGLARFDGTRFIEFKHDVLDTTTLGNNAIWCLVALPHGDLLIGTGEGLDRYDASSGHFAHMATGVEPDGAWRLVHADVESTLLYSPLSKLFLSVRGGTFSPKPSGHAPSYAMRVVDGGVHLRYHIWADTLIDQDLATGASTVQRVPKLANVDVSDLLPVTEGTILLSDKGACLFDKKGHCLPLPGEIGDRLQEGDGVKHVERAPDGRLWFSMNGSGVYVVDENWNITAHYPLLPDGERPLNITCIAFDRQGNTWVGTDGKGVFRIAPQRIKFGRVMPGTAPGWSPSSWFVRGFAQWDSVRVLVSLHQGGAALFSGSTGRLEPLDLPGLIAKELPDNSISLLLNDEQGNIWMKVATELIVLDPTTERVVDRMKVVPGAVLLPVPRGGLVLVQYPAIHEATIKEGQIALEPRPYPAFQQYVLDVKNLPQRLALDPTGQLWSSFLSDGIKVWAADGARAIGAGWEPLRGAVMKLGRIAALDNGDVLITTDHGLLQVDPHTRDLIRLRTNHDGLPDDLVYDVVVDGGTWWISTNKGLCRMRGEEVRNYSTADGVQSKEFNSRACFRSASGRIYFGGVNGFNHFMPDEVRDDPDRPIVRLTRLWTNNGDLPLPQDTGHVPLELPYPRNELHLELAVLEFSASELNTYKWRLPGYHDEWTTAKAATPIELNNVPGGEFTLEVIGVNGDGVESKVYRPLRIAVVRPFWASGWFIAVAVAVIIALVAWLWARNYRRRMLRKLEDAEREMKDLRMRTRLAKDIHDDVGSGLARMAALSRSPKRNMDTDARFEKLSDISGELLENLRDVVWINDPRQGTLEALLLRVREYANDLFEDTDATVSCEFPDPLPQHIMGGSFRRNLFLIAKEALHNARKYSGAKKVVLHWKETGDHFNFEVSDDGGGIVSKVPQGSGHGTANMRQRAEEMGCTYERIPTAGGGTTVRVHGRTSYL